METPTAGERRPVVVVDGRVVCDDGTVWQMVNVDAPPGADVTERLGWEQAASPIPGSRAATTAAHPARLGRETLALVLAEVLKHVPDDVLASAVGEWPGRWMPSNSWRERLTAYAATGRA